MPPPAPTLDQRLALRQRPGTAPVMFQRWTDVLLLHWQWDPDAIQATLPPGLHVDTHAGCAWLGVVPFWMEAVRPRGLPAVPWLSWFQELNLRTYVHDEQGRSGVWFYCLDCNQPLAVVIARTLFRLNYRHARQSGERSTQSPTATARFMSERRASGRVSRFAYRAAGPAAPAPPGTLSFFLAERYALFTTDRSGRLRCGRVWHQPYQLAPVHVDHAEVGLWIDQDFAPPNRSPNHTLLSAGVNVAIHPWESV